MILKTPKEKEYELIDTGEEEKLERFGDFILSRPDKEALWHKTQKKEIWGKADWKFERNGNKTKWINNKKAVPSWNINYGGLTFAIKPTSFKHIGLFPEQILNWKWIEEKIKKSKEIKPDKEINVLNLFAYTGGATLASLKAGASVCHVDASKQAVAWARENAYLSKLEDRPVRWITDDVLLFLKREIKRGRRYDAIIMDPPSFGHGPKDELWKIENDFLKLIELSKEVLSPDPIFFLINGYTAGYSAVVYENNLKYIFKDKGGSIESGELVIEEKSGNNLLPCGIFARWESK